MDKNVYFAKQLKKCLNESGKKQNELANAIGVSTASVNYWVKGLYIPKADKLEAIGEFFGINTKLLTDENFKPETDDSIIDYLRTFNEKEKMKLLERAEEIYKLKRYEKEN